MTSGDFTSDNAVEERLAPRGTKPTARPFSSRTQFARGRFFVGEPVAMHRPAQVALDRMEFPLTLPEGLRAAFADFVSTRFQDDWRHSCVS